VSAPTIDAAQRFGSGGDWHGHDFSSLRAAGLLVRDQRTPWFWTCPTTGASYTVSAVQNAQLQARYGEEAAARSAEQAERKTRRAGARASAGGGNVEEQIKLGDE
jgi:hypothetical protein